MTPLSGRILVTGGAGFIGSALVWALNGRGLRDIVVVDFIEADKRWKGLIPLGENSADKRRNLSPLHYAEFIEADVFRDAIARRPSAYGHFSTVFHLGACSSTTQDNGAYLQEVNIDYSTLLARWALAQGARFVYASSAATYGDGSAGMDDKDDHLDRLAPLNAYGRSKQAFDLFAQSQGWLDRVVGLKYFNVFGPNEAHKGDMRSLVAKAHQQILAGGSVRLFKSEHPDYRHGEQMRDFLYVKDAVEMTLHFADAGRAAGGLFNLGSGIASTWLELVRPIFAALGREPRIEFVALPEKLREKYQYFTRADIGKLRASGYARPVTPLSGAVADYVLNYLGPDRRLGQ